MSKRISDYEMSVDPMVYEILSSEVHELNGLVGNLKSTIATLRRNGETTITLDKLERIVDSKYNKSKEYSEQIRFDYNEARDTGIPYYQVSMKHFHERRRAQYPNINWDDIEKQDREDAEKRRMK